MGRELAANVIDRHRQRLRARARRITIDLDPTDDPTHGAQQLTFVNGHYDCWCYPPLLAFLTFNDEAEQYLCAAILRPGNAPATRGASGTLSLQRIGDLARDRQRLVNWDRPTNLREQVNRKGFIRRLVSSLHGGHLPQSVRVPLACHSKPWE